MIPELLLQALQLVLHGTPQLQIQRTKGFVQKKYLRIVHKCSGYGHTLALTAGKLLRLTPLKARKLNKLQHFFDSFC